MIDILEKYDGRQILFGDERHEVRGRLRGRPVVQLKAPDGVLHEISEEEFRLQVSLGNVVERDGQPEDGRLADPDERLEVLFREEVLRLSDALTAQGLTWPMRLEKMKRQLAEDPRFSGRRKPFPTERTIQKWRKAALRRGRQALVDGRYRSGNRTERHDQIFEEIVLDLLEEQYLTSDRMTVKAIARSAAPLYLSKCEAEGITPRPHGEKVVRSIIADLPHADVVKQRLGSAEARRKLLQAGQFQTVQGPLERVEIDSTTADVFVVIDDDGNVARPTICAAIDCATGVLVGLQVSLEASTSVFTAMTLKELMTPKDEAFFKEHGIEHPFQAYGRPLAVVSDQGSENSGEIIESIIHTAAFELRKNLPGHPDKKPYVERFFGTLRHFLMTLPGATQTADIGAKKRTELAKSEACIGFKEFVQLLQKWRYDVYALRPMRRVQSALRTRESPAAAWRRLCDEHLVPEPPTARELRQMFYASRALRKLHRYGIEHNSIQYSSAALRALFKEIGTGQTLEVRYDPTDIRQIAVINPLTGEHLLVPAKEEGLPAISFEALKAIRKTLEPSADEALTAQTILDAMTKRFHVRKTKPGTPMREARRRAAQTQADRAVIEKTRAATEREGGLAQHAATSANNRPIAQPTVLPRITPREST